MVTITSQIVLGWRGIWKLFRIVSTCVFAKRASGEQADASPESPQNIEGEASGLADASRSSSDGAAFEVSALEMV